MANIFDVAKFILKSYRYGISTRKLQKLTYFAQGWHLALTDKPLFAEDFSAWPSGPVSRDLYREHKGLYGISTEALKKGNAGSLDEVEAAIVEVVIDNYGSLTGVQLSELTSKAGTPWSLARESRGIGPDQNAEVTIEKDAMKVHFKELLSL